MGGCMYSCAVCAGLRMHTALSGVTHRQLVHQAIEAACCLTPAQEVTQEQWCHTQSPIRQLRPQGCITLEALPLLSLCNRALPHGDQLPPAMALCTERMRCATLWRVARDAHKADGWVGVFQRAARLLAELAGLAAAQQQGCVASKGSAELARLHTVLPAILPQPLHLHSRTQHTCM